MRDATSIVQPTLSSNIGLTDQPVVAVDPGGNTSDEEPIIGQIVPGYAVPVINERAVRVAATILFVAGFLAWLSVFTTGTLTYMKPFGMFFVMDMAIRVGIGDRWSPTLALGRLLTKNQPPQWVGASQKAFAWWLGVLMAGSFCAATGYLSAPPWVAMSLCGLCLSLLFLEAAFGICVGCKLQAVFSKTPPLYCPGGTCPPNWRN